MRRLSLPMIRMLLDARMWFLFPTLHFLPVFPLEVSPVLAFGVALFISTVIADVLFRTRRIPRVTTYIAGGLIFGVSGFGWISPDAILVWRPVIDVMLGILLFQLGQRIDVTWLRHNKWLAANSLFEVIGTLLAVFGAMYAMGMSRVSSALIAAIAVSTSPAVTICVTSEARSRGQVTDRALLLTGLNTVAALLLVKTWASWGHLELAHPSFRAILHPLYDLLGSVTVGFVMARLYGYLSRFLSQRPDIGVVHVALVLVIVQVGYLFRLSPFLILLVAGIIYRAGPRVGMPHVRELDFLLHPLQAFLFLTIASALSWQNWRSAVGAVGILVVVRAAAKIGVTLLFGLPSGLRLSQSIGLGLALLPASALALLLTIDCTALFPQLDPDVRPPLLGMIMVFQLAGPLLARLGLGRLAGECHPFK